MSVTSERLSHNKTLRDTLSLRQFQIVLAQQSIIAESGGASQTSASVFVAIFDDARSPPSRERSPYARDRVATRGGPLELATVSVPSSAESQVAVR